MERPVDVVIVAHSEWQKLSAELKDASSTVGKETEEEPNYPYDTDRPILNLIITRSPPIGGVGKTPHAKIRPKAVWGSIVDRLLELPSMPTGVADVEVVDISAWL